MNESLIQVFISVYGRCIFNTTGTLNILLVDRKFLTSCLFYGKGNKLRNAHLYSGL